MPALAKQLCLASVLALAMAHAQNSPQSASPDPLEAARRDLKELRNVDRGTPASNRLEEVVIPLPSFRPADGPAQPKISNVQPEANSEGWLLDALRDPARRSGIRGATDRAGLTRELESRTGRTVVNPLDKYIQQWISPENRGILRALQQQDDRRDWQRVGRAELAPKTNDGAVAGLLPLPLERSSANTRVNPYLQGSAESPIFLEPARSDPPNLRNRTNAGITPVETALPLPSGGNNDEFPTLKGKRDEKPFVPPTAPLVDEAKYFPQLRKF